MDYKISVHFLNPGRAALFFAYTWRTSQSHQPISAQLYGYDLYQNAILFSKSKKLKTPPTAKLDSQGCTQPGQRAALFLSTR